MLSVDDESVCELHCQAVGETFYNRLAKWVVDGTRCRPDAMDVCVTGVCKVSQNVELNLQLY